MYLILMFTKIELFESPALTPLRFCLCGWMKSEVNKIKLDKPDELVARILDAAGSIKRREDQMRRTTRDLRTPVAKCSEVDGGILGTFIVNCNRFVISV
jgi:hypothetical protein